MGRTCETPLHRDIYTHRFPVEAWIQSRASYEASSYEVRPGSGYQQVKRAPTLILADRVGGLPSSTVLPKFVVMF